MQVVNKRIFNKLPTGSDTRRDRIENTDNFIENLKIYTYTDEFCRILEREFAEK